MKCPNCSAKLNEHAKFCHLCGTPLDDENTQIADDTDNNQNAVPYNSEPFDPFADNDDELFRKGAGDKLYQAEKPALRGKRYREPQKKPRKKALILSIIALVLVVAITAGVIIIVNHNTVSAKELEEAKENYLPPAQAVSIDTSLDDPSNDKIQFKYDDRARIISCTYSVNDKTYDQSYTYDDANRNINIVTNYRKHPIFTKDIDYGVVKDPNVFEEHDGYYIRIDNPDNDSDTSSSSSSSQAISSPATDAPTEAPTEEPTEEPTEAASDWRDIYIDFLNSTDLFYSEGILLYLNDDDTPELLLSGLHQGAQVKTFHVCWISGTEVQHETIGAMGCSYQESTRNLRFSSRKIMYGSFTKYSFDGSSLSQYQSGEFSGSNNELEYTVDGETVSEEEYDAALDDGDTWSSVIFTYQKANITDQIRNYH